MELTKVFIVILNHNGHKNTIECLESVYKLDYPYVQILLVDNSSSEQSVNEIMNWADGKQVFETTSFPDLVLPNVNKPIQYLYLQEDLFDANVNYQDKLIIIRANENKGFASGNNIALQYVLGFTENYFVWLLNNDTVVKNDTLTQLLNYCNNDESIDSKIGLVGSKLLYYNNPETINGIGGIYNKWLGVASHLGESEIDKGQYNVIDCSNIQYVIGASMFLSKKFLIEVGLMSEDYFLFFEELDWAYRAKAKGWKMGFVPRAVVYHKESASISPDKTKSILFETSFLASRIIFNRKFNKVALVYIYFMMVPMLINRVRRRQFSRILPLLNAAIKPFAFKDIITKQLKNSN